MASLLVTGGAGMLGQAVTASAIAAGHEVRALSHRELDIADAAAVTQAVARAAPAAILNCAAWTDVDGAEADEAGATVVNGDGAGNVARACAACGARIVHVSTDYVFAGDGHRPYLESDPVAPRTAYGRSKLDGEQQVAVGCADHAIVRTAWLFGAGGRNFVDTMVGLGGRAVAADGAAAEVAVVDDQVGSPTWTGHLAPALVAIATGDAKGVLHVAGAGSGSWRDLALAAFERAGVRCHVRPATTAEFPRPAPRPAYSALASERGAPALPDWREGVAAHLAPCACGDPFHHAPIHSQGHLS